MALHSLPFLALSNDFSFLTNLVVPSSLIPIFLFTLSIILSLSCLAASRFWQAQRSAVAAAEQKVGEDLVEIFAVCFGLHSVAPLHDPVVTLYHVFNRDRLCLLCWWIR
jgi:predicted membrane protein